MGLFNKWEFDPEKEKAKRQQLIAECDESEEKDDEVERQN